MLQLKDLLDQDLAGYKFIKVLVLKETKVNGELSGWMVFGLKDMDILQVLCIKENEGQLPKPTKDRSKHSIEEEFLLTKDGKVGFIGLSKTHSSYVSVNSREEIKRLIKTCLTRNIPYQIKVELGEIGN